MTPGVHRPLATVGSFPSSVPSSINLKDLHTHWYLCHWTHLLLSTGWQWAFLWLDELGNFLVRTTQSAWVDEHLLLVRYSESDQIHTPASFCSLRVFW